MFQMAEYKGSRILRGTQGETTLAWAMTSLRKPSQTDCFNEKVSLTLHGVHMEPDHIACWHALFLSPVLQDSHRILRGVNGSVSRSTALQSHKLRMMRSADISAGPNLQVAVGCGTLIHMYKHTYERKHTYVRKHTYINILTYVNIHTYRHIHTSFAQGKPKISQQ